MRAAFITIHVGYNFGSVLQTIATGRVLEEEGVEPVCINYIPPRVTEKRYWKEGMTSGVRFFRRLLFFPIHYYAEKKYSRYLEKHCRLSTPIYNEDDFTKKCPHADFYVTGSDQVWNYKHNEGIDANYFFECIEGKKIAFASSIGMTELPQDYTDYMKQALKSFSAISVRESSAVELLAKWGIESTHLIDPTLMLNKATWAQYASPRLCKEPYLFVYLPYNVSDKEMVYSSVRKIASKNNLKVVTYTWDHRKDNMADKTITFADPGDVLSLFLHADKVITNSFHGTAFSINLNKQFWVYMPSLFSTRLLSLIDLCGLKERMLDCVIGDELMDRQVDFSQANQVLEIERNKARNFLKNALS